MKKVIIATLLFTMLHSCMGCSDNQNDIESVEVSNWKGIVREDCVFFRKLFVISYFFIIIFYIYTVIANCRQSTRRIDRLGMNRGCRSDILLFFNQNLTVKFSYFEKFSYICGVIR